MIENNKKLKIEINEVKLENKNIDNEDFKKKYENLLEQKNKDFENLKNEYNELQKKLQIKENIIKDENKLINDKVFIIQKGLKDSQDNLQNCNNEKDKKINILNINNKNNKNEISKEIEILTNQFEEKEEIEKKENNNKIKTDLDNKEKIINDDSLKIKLEQYEKKIKEYEININEKEENEKKNKNLIIKLEKENKEEKEKKLNTQNESEKKIKNKEELLEESKNNIIDYKNQIEEYKNKEKQILKKEKEINCKINFLEDKENLIEKENNAIKIEREKLQKEKEENNKLKKENEELIIKNKELEKEINEKQKLYNKILSNIKESSEDNNSNKQNQKNINYIDKIKEIGNFVPLIGLNNIGATCFMNATLQCLSQTKSLTNYFLNEKNRDRIMNNNINIKNKNEPQLSPIYLELIQKLWDKNGNKSFSPNNFMNVIEIMNPLFKKGQAGDSKDFIIFILEQLHKELKKSIKKNNINNIEQQPLNQYDKNNAFNHFFNEFQNDCSIISDIFFGFNETTNECIQCKNNYNSNGLENPICYNYGIFNCLIFPLEEVKKMKNNSYEINNIHFNNNAVTLDECFFYNQKTDYFTGDNKNYCNLCKQLYDSMYKNKIFVSPNVLVLILNRGKDNIYNVKLYFNENIDITQFVLQKDKPRITYSLYGVITHIGQSGPNAHFVASCKSPINNRWYRYNDALINEITNIQKDIIEFGTPYILFYQRND